MRIDGVLKINSSAPGTYQDRTFTAARVAEVLDGAGGTGTARATMTASYYTTTVDPTVYFTALGPTGSVITPRTHTGISFLGGLWTYAQPTSGVTDFIAVWDEGDPNLYASEWIVVDT